MQTNKTFKYEGLLRAVIQAGFTVFTIYAGHRFFLFYQWATGVSDQFVPRPPSVEGFLPISALLGLKQLVSTGKYDEIHPAGLTIFLAAILMAFLLRRSFCGWICPVGAVSNLIEKAGRRMGTIREPPGPVHYPLLSLKYLLLAFFLSTVLIRMGPAEVEAFIRSPYNITADGRMLRFFMEPSGITIGVLAFLVIASLVVRNFWCRYLCPYGALLGLFAWVGPLRIERDPGLCIGCRKCTNICPAGIKVHRNRITKGPECIGCLECTLACPVPGCLTTKTPGPRTIHGPVFALAVLGVFLGAWIAAMLTGHWTSRIPPELFQRFYMLMMKTG